MEEVRYLKAKEVVTKRVVLNEINVLALFFNGWWMASTGSWCVQSSLKAEHISLTVVRNNHLATRNRILARGNLLFLLHGLVAILLVGWIRLRHDFFENSSAHSTCAVSLKT